MSLQQVTTYWLVKNLGAAWISGDTAHIVEGDIQQAKEAPCQMTGRGQFGV